MPVQKFWTPARLTTLGRLAAAGHKSTAIWRRVRRWGVTLEAVRQALVRAGIRTSRGAPRKG